MKTQSLSRRVELSLESRRGECMCDNCIATELEQAVRKNVQSVTSRLAFCEHGYCKYRGRCSICGAYTLVTIASRSTI